MKTMCNKKYNAVFLTDSKDYDVFGTPLSVINGLNSLYESTVSTSYGYLGKPYDVTTKLYNYGYRDYSSRVGRFTTVDPVRDGANWYAYVNDDPVNYVDLWGLCQSGTDKKQILGEGMGEAFPTSSTKNDTSIVTELNDGAFGIYSTTSKTAAVIEYSTKTNTNGAYIGEMKLYPIENNSAYIEPTTTPILSVPVVSGVWKKDENGATTAIADRTQKGIYLDVPTESTSVSSNPILQNGSHGDYYYRLPETGGQAIHGANPETTTKTAWTESCTAISGKTPTETQINTALVDEKIAGGNVIVIVK